MSDYIVPVGASLLPHVGGFLGGYVTKNNIKTWYEVSRYFNKEKQRLTHEQFQNTIRKIIANRGKNDTL